MPRPDGVPVDEAACHPDSLIEIRAASGPSSVGLEIEVRWLGDAFWMRPFKAKVLLNAVNGLPCLAPQGAAGTA